MTTRHTAFGLITMVISMVILAPVRGAALPVDAWLDPCPSKVRSCRLGLRRHASDRRLHRDATGQLRLTGVLSGTAAHRTGQTPITRQPFTASATLQDPGHTTDVVRLALEPIAINPIGVQITLAPIFVDIEALPQVADELTTPGPTP